MEFCIPELFLIPISAQTPNFGRSEQIYRKRLFPIRKRKSELFIFELVWGPSFDID